MIAIFEGIFWISLLFIIYTYFGYPVLLIALAKLRNRPVDKGDFVPRVTMIIAAHNEESAIGSKLENAIDADYPDGKLDIIVVSDGSSDETDSIVEAYSSRGVTLLRMQKRGGKARALNSAVPHAKGEIIVFSDTRQLYDREAIRELAANFSDESIGAVSGELCFKQSDGSIGKGVGMYWRYEKFLRKRESRIYSTLGATGAIYAIRKNLYKPIAEDTILDDVVIPTQIMLSGYRVIFEEKARAYDDVADTAKEELTRKIRTLCGNYQAFMRMSRLFNPFRNKAFFQFMSHKVFRLIVPFALMLMLISNIFLISSTFYQIVFILQICMYLSAVVGHYLSKRRKSFIGRLFGIPYTLVVLNYAAVAGLYRFITGKQKIAWEKAAEHRKL